MNITDEHRDALARIIDPEGWELYDDKRMVNRVQFRETLVEMSRDVADQIIKSGLMASMEWERAEYFKARDRILEGTSRTGKCYGVEDGLDGYCRHDPRCRSWPETAMGPNSDCVR